MRRRISRITTRLGLDNGLRAAIRKVRVATARREISRLQEISPKLGRALADALGDRLDRPERDWVKRIEAARLDLLRSTETMVTRDYGAAEAGRDVSEEGPTTPRVLEVSVGERCRLSSKPYFWSLLLMKLIREFRPVRCVELGTCMGISAAYQGAALALNAESGTLATIEGCPETADFALGNLHGLGLQNVTVVVGLFQDVLPGVLEDQQPVDFVFVDGHHDEEATLGYLEMLRPHLSETALLVFDDISWSAGMREAWNRIQTDSEVSLAVDLAKVGICVARSGGGSSREVLRIPLI